MNKKQITLFFQVLFLVISCSYGQNITTNDLQVIQNTKWTGSLNYLDFRTRNIEQIDVYVEVKQTSKNKYNIDYNFPNEPFANYNETIVIKSKGRKINKSKISEVKRKSNFVIIKTEEKGKDNKKKAIIYTEYYISDKSFKMQKDIAYIDPKSKQLSKKITRNQFTLKPISN